MLRVLRGFNGEFAPVLRAPLFVFPGLGFGDRIAPTSKPPSFPDKPRMPVDPLKQRVVPAVRLAWRWIFDRVFKAGRSFASCRA